MQMVESNSQAQARIYLATRRGCSRDNGYLAFHSLNFATYQAGDRESFFALHALNDEVLKAGATIRHPAPSNSLVLILPVVGGLKFRIDDREAEYMEVETCQLISVPRGSVLAITNLYEQESINFITAWISKEDGLQYAEQFALFNLQGKKNQFVEIFRSSEAAGYLGKFSGRTDQIFPLKASANGAFVVVLDGAVEVEKRLLESRDALALWNTQTIGFEPLSQDAIVLIFQV